VHEVKAAQVVSLGTGRGWKQVCGETSYRPARENDPVRQLLEVTQQFGQGDLETECQHFENTQTRFPAPILQLGDMDPANSCNFGKIRLIPTPISSQLS